MTFSLFIYFFRKITVYSLKLDSVFSIRTSKFQFLQSTSTKFQFFLIRSISSQNFHIAHIFYFLLFIFIFYK
jgi:hypothetical protein